MNHQRGHLHLELETHVQDELSEYIGFVVIPDDSAPELHYGPDASDKTRATLQVLAFLVINLARQEPDIVIARLDVGPNKLQPAIIFPARGDWSICITAPEVMDELPIDINFCPMKCPTKAQECPCL